MPKVKVAQLGLIIDPQKRLNVLNFNLPEGTKILSVSKETNTDNNQCTLWITYHSPADAYDNFTKDTYPWRTYCFSIVMCRYTDFEINHHQYIGDITIPNGTENNTYSVFYELGATLKKQ